MMPHPLLPAEIRRVHVSREQFITAQHYEAWRVGMPLRRHLSRRKKFSREEIDNFFKHREYKCVECESRTLITLDHIVPQILGGSSFDINLRPLCGPCNRAAWKPFALYLRLYDQWLVAA